MECALRTLLSTFVMAITWVAAASASGEIGDATVTVPPAPTAQELAGNSLDEFILHHATTHYVNDATARNLARWCGGKSNVQILFTNKPQEKMDEVWKWATGPAFRNRYAGGMKNLIAYKSDHAIQGWYLITSGGAAVLNTDFSLVGISVRPVWPQIIQNYSGSGSLGTRLGGGSGSGSGIGMVILVADTTKVVGSTIGALADYLTMLALSVAQSPDHCDPLPSILDLMSSNCAAREAPTAITAGDLAFLKALYYKNTGLGPSLSRYEIQGNMMGQFRLR